MKSKTKKIILAVAVIGVVAAGGAAFTEANVVPDSVAGYDTTTITGATATDVNYTMGTNGDTIASVKLTFVEDISAQKVQIAFNDGALGPDADCVITGLHVADCDTHAQNTVAATKLDVVVHS